MKSLSIKKLFTAIAALLLSFNCLLAQLSVSITSINPTCYGLCNGMATAVPSGGTPPYTYLWDNTISSTTATAIGLCADTLYTVVVTDSIGNDTTTGIILSQPASLTGSVSFLTNASCNGLCDGMATATISGGTKPYTYQWLDSTFTPLAPAQTDSTATGLCAGLYILQANDSNNCFVIATTTINQPPELTSSITDTTQASCSGACIGSVTVTPAGGASPYTYLWDDPAGQTDSTVTGLCAGTYTVTITDTNGCMILESINITQPPILTIALVSTIPASCNGCDGEAVVTGIAGTPPYTYLWDDSLEQTTSTANSLCGSTYNVTVTDDKGCVAALAVVVSSESGLSSGITTVTNMSCAGVCDGEAIVAVSGGSLPYIYSWDLFGVPMPAETDSIITGLCAGNYTAVITDNNGCITSAPVIITQPAVFTSSITSNTEIACNGLCDGMATVTAVGGTLPYTYNWLDDVLNPIGQITPTADNLCAGVYNVAIDDANGCFSVSVITITEPLPLTSVITDSSTLVCVCDGFATVTPSGGTTPYTYFWDPDVSGQTDSTATGLCAGVYNVTVTDANGCVVTLPVVITALNGLASTIDTSINASCNGVCDGEAVVLASGGIPPFTYAWVDLPADTISGQTNSIITGLCPGNYLAIVSDSDGCITATTVTITEPSVLTSNVTNVVLVSCFDSCDGSAVVTPSGGTAPYTYLWDPQTGGQTDSTAVDLCIGTYNAVVTDVNNCSDTSSVTITGPTILFLITDATCLGICDGTATAQPVGGLAPYTYLWDDPLSQTDSIATGLCEGAYTVIVTDANGCVILDSAAIITPSTQISQTNASCSNICDGTATAQPVGGLAPYTYLWDDVLSQTDSMATGLCEGNYTVIVTDANGCATANSALIAVDNVSPIAVAGDNITICEGESILLMASGGTSYAWSPSSGLSCTSCQSPEANPASTTTYTVIVTNLACSDTDAVIITVGLCLENIPQVITPNGDGANDIFEITGIESYPENRIMIFNRWGNIMFSADGYHNVNNYWDGTSNNGGRLPDGIYFYILNLGDGNEPYTGFVMIHR